MSNYQSLERQIRLLTDKIESIEEKIQPKQAAFSTKEFGDRFGKSQKWVGRMCRLGRIRSITPDKPYLIPSSEVDRICKDGI